MSTPDKSPRKLGRFIMTRELIESAWPILAPLLEVVVVKAQMNWPDTVEYYAYCDAFEEVPENSIVPEYIAFITHPEDGKTTLEWKKA